MSLPLQAVRFGRQMVEQGLAAVPITTVGGVGGLPLPGTPHPVQRPALAPPMLRLGRTPIDLVKEVKGATGVKVNDVVMAVCAGSVAQLPQTVDALPHPSPCRPGTGLDPYRCDPFERRDQVGSMSSRWPPTSTIPRSTSCGPGECRCGQAVPRDPRGTPQPRAQRRVPPPLFGVAARSGRRPTSTPYAPPVYNVIISNVAGPPVDFYIAGARVEAMYPMGPLLYGGGLNITVFSNGGPSTSGS